MTAPTITTSALQVTHEIVGAEPLTGADGAVRANHLAGDRVRPNKVVVGLNDLGPWAYVEGERLRKNGKPYGRCVKTTVFLATGDPRDPFWLDLPVNAQPAWLRELVRDSIRYLQAADREMVLNP